MQFRDDYREWLDPEEEEEDDWDALLDDDEYVDFIMNPFDDEK